MNIVNLQLVLECRTGKIKTYKNSPTVLDFEACQNKVEEWRRCKPYFNKICRGLDVY